ncbi:MAG: hypothetical protein QXP29_05545 [Candidatus Nezhaarchaeales archaeon]
MYVARILGLPREMVDGAKALSKTVMERRLARAEEAKPEAIKGEETTGVELSRKQRSRGGRHTERSM